MLRAVLFDLDGVVRHFYPQHVVEIEQRHNLPSGVIERCAFDHPLIDHVITGKISRREWIARIGAHLGDQDAATEWGNQPFRADSDTLQIADDLRTLGIATPILTNGTDTIPAETAQLGLHAFFEPIFNSAAIGYCKPDRRVFTHVLETLNISPTDMFFTDDSINNLAGAAELGIITHHFVNASRLRSALREHGVNLQ